MVKKQADKQALKGRADHLVDFRWKKGQTGNPKGRPRGPTLTTVLKQMLENTYTYKDPETGEIKRDAAGRTNREIIVGATIALATKGHAQALKEVWNRIDGRVPLALENPDGSGIFDPMGDVKAKKVATAVLSFLDHRKGPKKAKKTKKKVKKKVKKVARAKK